MLLVAFCLVNSEVAKGEMPLFPFDGETAIVAGGETVVRGGRIRNAGKTEHLRFTGIWMKQGGRWQEVATHANIRARNNELEHGYLHV